MLRRSQGVRTSSRSWAKLSFPLAPFQLSREQCVRVELHFVPAWPPSHCLLWDPPDSRAGLVHKPEAPDSVPLCHAIPSASVSSNPPGHCSLSFQIQLKGQRASSGRATLTYSPPPEPRLPAHFASPMPGDLEGWSHTGLNSDPSAPGRAKVSTALRGGLPT